MQKRRDFLKNAGVAAVGAFMLSEQALAGRLFSVKGHAIGLQLYTVSGPMEADPAGTLKQLADIGYREAESATSRKGGYYGMTAKEFSKMAKDNGITWVSHHIGGTPWRGRSQATADNTDRPKILNLQENAQEAVDQAAEGGLPYLVCSSTAISTGDEIKMSAEILQKAGEIAKKAGIVMGYHNHTHEFEEVDGIKALDYFMTQISADILKFEVDLGWATKAGVNPVELFQKSPGRFPLWHVKDLDKESQQPVEVGKGYIDFKPIFAASKTSGMKHFFVEQDAAPDPMTNVATSLKFIEGMGV